MHDQEQGTGRSALRALIATGLLLAAPAQAATRGFTITGFDAVRIDAPVKVILTTGGSIGARADGDQAALDRLRVEVSGRLLTVTMDRRAGEKASSPATLRLSTQMVSRIVLAGGGSVMVDRMKGLAGQLVLGGSGDIAIADVQLDRLDLMLGGAGRVTLAGRAGVANFQVIGPGAIVAAQLRARQLTIGNNGPGSIAASADVNATVTASGSGDISVDGKPACTVTNRGTGTIRCGADSY